MVWRSSKRCRRLQVVGAMVVAAAVSWAGGTFAQPPADAVHEEENETAARQAFAAGRYGEALDLYRLLHARTHHPTYLRNVGRCLQMMKRPEEAIATFRDYLRVAPDLPVAAREQVEGFIREMEALARQRREAQGPARAPAAPAALTGPPSTGAGSPRREPAPALDLALVQKVPASPADRRSGGAGWLWIAGGGLVVAAAAVAGVLLLRPAHAANPCPAPDCSLPRIEVPTR